MHMKIARWGNSNAVRLPAELLADAGLAPGSEVRLTMTDRGILIEPAEPRYKLADLVERMTPEKAPGEIEWGAPVGGEVIE